MKLRLVIIISTMIFLSFSIATAGSNIAEKVEAQNMHSMSGMQSNNATANGNVSSTTNKVPNFSSKGIINTLWYIVVNNSLLNPSDKPVSISNITNGLDLAAKSIGNGNWSIDVDHGRVKQFNAKIDVVNADGTNAHTHALGNFTSNGNPQVILSPDNTTTIQGKLDVALNGQTAWKNVDSTTIISKDKAIQILLNDKKTENHFVQQPIYGRVTSFIG